MKRIFLTLLAVAAIAIVPSANAQKAGSYTTTLNGGTNNVAATATNTYTAAITCEDYDNVGLDLSFKAVSSLTGNITVRVAKACVSGNYESVPTTVITIPANGTTVVNYPLNITTPSAIALKLTSIENTNSVAITNVTASWRLKAPKRVTRQAAN